MSVCRCGHGSESHNGMAQACRVCMCSRFMFPQPAPEDTRHDEAVRQAYADGMSAGRMAEQVLVAEWRYRVRQAEKRIA